MITRIALAAWLSALTAYAHMISISTGEVRLEGARLHYEMHMPAYEVTALRNFPEELAPRVDFPDAKRLTTACQTRPTENAVVCVSEWQFPASPKTVRVRSRLHQVTVANHVHLVSAVRGGVVDQAVLEVSAPEAEIRFAPQSPAEAAYMQFAAGARRAIAGPPQILFLFALILGARSRREFLILVVAFTAGQVIATLMQVSLAPQFVEAAAALAVAYLAVEILFLPDAQYRWIVVALLGGLQGLAYAALVNASHFSPYWVLLGGFTAALSVLGVGGAVWKMSPWRPARPLAIIVLAISLGWFAWRVALA